MRWFPGSEAENHHAQYQGKSSLIDNDERSSLVNRGILPPMTCNKSLDAVMHFRVWGSAYKILRPGIDRRVCRNLSCAVGIARRGTLYAVSGDPYRERSKSYYEQAINQGYLRIRLPFLTQIGTLILGWRLINLIYFSLPSPASSSIRRNTDTKEAVRCTTPTITAAHITQESKLM